MTDQEILKKLKECEDSKAKALRLIEVLEEKTRKEVEDA